MALDEHPIWRRPRHHLDLDEKHDHVHWVELFYDLIHVVTIFLLGNYLSDHANMTGFAVFSMMFIALFFAWGELSIFNSIYVSTDFWHRMIMAMMIITVMFMAAAIPNILGGGWPYFVLGYAFNRLGLALLYLRARKLSAETNSVTYEMARNLIIFAFLFVITAFLPTPIRYTGFIIVLLLMQLTYMIPSITILRLERFTPRWGHVSERFALLTLIVLGESFFKLVLTLSEKGIYKVGSQILTNFAIGGLSTFLLAWIYFDIVGNAKPKDQRLSTMVIYWLASMVLMLCAVLIGVAVAGIVKVGFWEPYPLKYATMGCFGLAGFILCIGVLQSRIEPRVAHQFTGWKTKAFGVFMSLFTLVIIPYVPSLIGNFFWGIAVCSQIFLPIGRAYLKLSKEESAY